MKAASTSVNRTAAASRMRRSRFHRFRWGSKKICLSTMNWAGPVCTWAKTASTVYAIQYESYGSCPRESIDGAGPEIRRRAQRAACDAGPCCWPGDAAVDARGVLRGQWGRAGLWGIGEEPAAVRPLCSQWGRRRDVFHADPAARLSTVSGCLLPGIRDGELCFGSLGADCAGVGRLPAAGRFCAPHCLPRGGAGDALAGGALPLHGFLFGGPDAGIADSVCDRAGAVVSGAIPGKARVGQCTLVYVCGQSCGPAEAGWSAGGGGAGAGAGGGIGARDCFARETGAHGRGLRVAGADALCRLDLADRKSTRL